MRLTRNELLRRVKDNVKFARHQRQNLDREWQQNIAHLMGSAWDEPAQMERVSVNMTWSTLSSLIPSIYFQNPKVNTKGRRPQDLEKAPIVRAALNYWIDQMGTKKIIQRGLSHATVYPFGVLKIGYVTHPVDVTVQINEDTGEVKVIDESKQIDMTEHRIERQTVQLGSRPVLNNISLRNFWIDPTATEWDGPHADAEWVAEEFTAHLDDLRADPNYENTGTLTANTEGRREIDAVSGSDYVPENESGPFSVESGYPRSEDYSDLVTCYEYWDLRRRKLYVFADGHEKFLRHTDWPYDMEGFPYIKLQLVPDVPDQLYPVPLFTVIADQQRELNKIRTYQLDFAKRAGPKVFVNRAMFDPDDIDAMRAGDGLPFIPVNGDPNEAAVHFQGSTISPEVPRAEATIKNDIYELSGMAENQRMAMGQSGRTATEINRVAEQVSVKVRYYQDMGLDAIASIGRKLLALLKQFWDEPAMIRLSGRPIDWHEFTAEDIHGEFDLEVRAGSQLNPDQAVQIKQTIDLLNLLAPMAMGPGSVINIVELVRMALDAYGTVDPDRIVIDKSPEQILEEQMAVAQADAQPTVQQGRRATTPGHPQAPRLLNEKAPGFAGIQRGTTRKMGL